MPTLFLRGKGMKRKKHSHHRTSFFTYSFLVKFTGSFCAHVFWFLVGAGLFLLTAAPSFAQDLSWPQEAHDGRRTNYSPVQGVDDPALVPMFPEGSEPFSQEAEGDVLTGADNTLILRDGYYPGEHVAYDIASQKILWRYPRSAVNKPAIGVDGIVYVYGENGEPTALDPDTGAVLWQDTTVSSRGSFGWTASPVIDESGNVYFQIDSGFAVYAAGSTKKLLWKYSVEYFPYDLKGFAVYQGIIYFLDSNNLNYLCAIDSSSSTTLTKLKWYFTLSQFDDSLPDCSKENCSMNSVPLVGSDGTIYIRHYHYVFAIKDKGSSAELLWKKKIDGTASFSTGVWPLAPPVLDSRGHLYVWSIVNDTLSISCLDTSNKGNVVWTKSLSDQTSYPDALLGAGDRLYILYGGTNGGALYALSMTDGSILFTRTYTGSPHGQMAIAPDGTIYYTADYYSRDGHYYKNNTIMMLGKVSNTAPSITSLTARPTEGKSPLEVTFSTTATDFEGDEFFYQWDFGDGQTSTEEDPRHTFTEPGTYTVTLTVTDSKGASSSQTITITVYEEELPPGGGGSGGGTDNQTQTLTVSINASPTSGHPPLEVACEAVPNHTYQNMSYAWSFGDGSSGSGRTVTHTYTTAGTYTVQLTCQSTYQTATASKRIRVTPAGRQSYDQFSCLTIEADNITCTGEDNCTLSGNVVINDFLKVDGSVRVVGSKLSGSGDLTITTEDGEEVVLSTGDFEIQADLLDDDHECSARLDTADKFFLNLFGFQVDYQNLHIYEDHVEIPGKLRIQAFITVFEAEVTIIYSERGMDFAGKISLPDIDLSGFELSDVELEIDTFSGEAKGSGTLKTPGLKFEVGAEIGFLYGVLNMVKVEIGDLNKPILYSPPPAPAPIVFLQSISGGLENIAPRAPDPIVLMAGASFSGGPKVELPSLDLLSGTLKVGGGEYEMLGGDIDLELDTGGRFTAEGTGYLLNDDFGTFGELVLIVDINRGVYISGTLYYPPGEDFAILIVNGQGKIDFDLNFQAALQGTLKAPNIFWLIGGMTFADAKAYIDNELISAGVQFGDRICVPLVGCVNLTIKASVTFRFENGEFSVARNWDNIGEVTFSHGRLFSLSGRVAAQSSGSQRFTLTGEEQAVIFRLEAPGGQASFTLEDPDKTVYTPDTGNALWHRNDELGEVWCAVPSPKQGEWIMTVSGAAKDYTCQLLRQNREPEVTITEPVRDMTVQAGEKVSIRWDAADEEDDALVSLFYDEDREGNDGTLICKDVPASQGVFSWDTAAVPPGRYYLYAKADDGKNIPVIAYSKGAVTVRNDLIGTPRITAVAQGEDGLSVAWEPVEGAAGYRLYYDSAFESKPLRQCSAVAVWGESGAALHELAWGKTYRIAVSAFDREGRESALSEAVQVKLNNRSGNNAPQILSRPAAMVQAGKSFQYQVRAVDADGDRLSYAILRGPSGMSVSTGGLVSWVPGDRDVGTHRVKLQAADPAGAGDNQTFYLSVLSREQNLMEPYVSIECSTTVGQAPLSVSFSAIAHDIRGEGLSYQWDFGDGESSTEQSPRHVFQQQGFYTVELVVTSAAGLTATSSVVIEATGASEQTIEPPVATVSVSGSQVQLTLAPSGSVQGNRMYLGEGAGSIDYEHPFDLGQAMTLTFYNVPAGRYAAVFRSYLAQSGETWDSAKKVFTVLSRARTTENLPSGVLEGKVFDAQTRHPVAGSQVNFAFYRTTTDQQGGFRFEGLPEIKKGYVQVTAAGYRSVWQEVALGEEQRILLEQGDEGTDNQTCPAAQYLPEHAQRLRLFRDNVLSQSPAGSNLIQAYYRAAPRVAGLLRENAKLRQQTLSLARDMMPLVRKRLQGTPVHLSLQLRKRIDALLATYAATADPDLLALGEAVKQFLQEKHARSNDKL